MSRAALGLTFAAVFFVSLLVFFPLKAALAWLDPSPGLLRAGSIEGTIWSGRLHDAALGALPLGEVEIRLSPLGLLNGSLRARLDAAAGHAVVVSGRQGLGLRDANAVAPLSALGLPVEGALRLQQVSVRMSDGCRWASGRLTLEGLRLGSYRGGGLTGQVACRSGKLVAPLTGSIGGLPGTVRIEVEPSGAVLVETRLSAADPALREALVSSGFEPTMDGVVRIDRARLTPAPADRTAR